MPKSDKPKKENKNIIVWFGDNEEDEKLRERIDKGRKSNSASSFLKDAVTEKLDRDELFNEIYKETIKEFLREKLSKQEDNIEIPEVQKNDEDDKDDVVDGFINDDFFNTIN